jgi:hypothetical protein
VVQIGAVRTSVYLDKEMESELERAVDRIKEKPATVLRLAIRAGLPLVAGRFQAPRPEGYFADAYPQPNERRELEAAMGRAKQRPER